MSDAVHANLEDLRRLQKAVDVAVQEVNDSLKKLQRTVARADWTDSASRSFDTQLNAATASVRQTTQRLSELKPILNREIQALQEYLRRR
jgi:uncharacterized phage infection (PIP) family protein YhgE